MCKKTFAYILRPMKPVSIMFFKTAILLLLCLCSWGCLAINNPPEIPANEVSPDISYLWPEEKSLIKKTAEPTKRLEGRNSIGANNGIIAVVNDRLITLKEFDSTFFRALQNKRNVFKKEYALYDEILNEMIDQLLLLELAIQKEVEILPEEIERELEKLVKRHPKGWDGLRRELESQKSSIEAYKENIKDSLMLKKLRSQIVGYQNIPSPKDVQKKYQERIEDFQSPEKRDISLITIFNSDYDNQKRLIDRATKKISDRLKEEDFNKVLISMSGDGKGDGGLKGYIEKKDLAASISSIAFELSSGEWSGPHEMPGFQFFVKCNDVLPQETKSLDEVQDILTSEILNEMSYQKISKALVNIKASSYIRKMSHKDYVEYRRSLSQ